MNPLLPIALPTSVEAARKSLKSARYTIEWGADHSVPGYMAQDVEDAARVIAAQCLAYLEAAGEAA